MRRRASARRFAFAVALATCLAIASTAAQDTDSPAPFSRVAKDMVGSVVASIAIASGQPVLVGVGSSYKAADVVHDVGKAAIGREDRFRGAELVLATDEARRLRAIIDAGADPNGEAPALRTKLQAHVQSLTSAERSPLGYTPRVLVKHFPYAVFRVTLDKLFKKAFSAGLQKLGVSRWIERKVPLPKKVNWLLNYGGPLENVQKEMGWGKLGTRARGTEKSIANAMRDIQRKLAERELKEFGSEALLDSAAEALTAIYEKIMRENPSAPRNVVMSDFRLQAAQQAVLLPAPVLVIAPAAAAPEPIMRAAEAEPVMRAAEPVAPDPVIRTLRADDAFRWRPARSESVDTSTAPPPSRAEPPREDPRAAARRQRLHDELMRVGDGKTYVVCSNGCPNTPQTSWDGRRGQTLYGK